VIKFSQSLPILSFVLPQADLTWQMEIGAVGCDEIGFPTQNRKVLSFVISGDYYTDFPVR